MAQDLPPQIRPGSPIELTAEEQVVIKKCMSSSIITHTVPAMVGSGVFVQILKMRGVNLGFWGNFTAILTAGIAGRFAALPGCMQEVIQQVPHGAVAQKFENIKVQRNMATGKFAPENEVFSPEIYTPPEDRANTYNPNIQPPSLGASPIPYGSQSQSYDDLRRRNREQYIESRRPASSTRPAMAPPVDQPQSSPLYSPTENSSLYYDPSSSYIDPLPSAYNDPVPTVNSVDEEPIIRKRKRVNKYGDEIED